MHNQHVKTKRLPLREELIFLMGPPRCGKRTLGLMLADLLTAQGRPACFHAIYDGHGYDAEEARETLAKSVETAAREDGTLTHVIHGFPLDYTRDADAAVALLRQREARGTVVRFHVASPEAGAELIERHPGNADPDTLRERLCHYVANSVVVFRRLTLGEGLRPVIFNAVGAPPEDGLIYLNRLLVGPKPSITPEELRRWSGTSPEVRDQLHGMFEVEQPEIGAAA